MILGNTHDLKLIGLSRKKTDKIDAEKLAIYLKMHITSEEDFLEPVYVPEQRIRDLRSLFKTYELIRTHKVSVKNRIHSILKQNLYPVTKLNLFSQDNREMIMNLDLKEEARFQVELSFDELDKLEATLTKIKERILLVGFHYKEQIDILTSMKGISVLTAIALISDVADIRRFANSKKFASYLRSAPGVDSSNETTRNLKTNKAGRKLSISLLTQSLTHFRNSSRRLGNWYDTLIGRKSKGEARMALCRKVFTILYQMLKKNEYYWYRDKKNHMWKIQEYARFLKNHNISFALQDIA